MRVIGLIVGCVIAAAVIWQVALPSYSYRYRLTVSVEIDGKVHSGSSVIEVTWRAHPNFGTGRFLPSIRGQAAYVDLGTRGALVAVLYAGDGPRDLKNGPFDATWIAARAFGNQSTDSELPQLPGLSGHKELASDNMPRFVWFSDIADPATARPIPPSDIKALLGPEARLSAYVDITSDPIVIDIDKKLPWYPELEKHQKGQVFLRYPDQFQLLYNMFVGANR